MIRGPERASLREALESELVSARGEMAVSRHRLSEISARIAAAQTERAEIGNRAALLKVASSLLQQLVDAVSSASVRRVEELVCAALAAIFTDQDLAVRLVPDVKAGQVRYRLVFLKGGMEGTVQSVGGGVAAMVAVVLKVLFCRLADRYPLLVLDESLAFVADAYVDNASAFLRRMSAEFGMPILLVTHNSKFAAHADRRYAVKKAGPTETTIEEY